MRGRSALLVAVVAGCNSNFGYLPPDRECPRSSLGDVDVDDDTTLGFSGADVANSLGFDVTGAARSEALRDGAPVSVQTTFVAESAYRARFDGNLTDEAYLCPEGDALVVRLIRSVTGTIDGEPVSQSWVEEVAAVALDPDQMFGTSQPERTYAEVTMPLDRVVRDEFLAQYDADGPACITTYGMAAGIHIMELPVSSVLGGGGISVEVGGDDCRGMAANLWDWGAPVLGRGLDW